MKDPTQLTLAGTETMRAGRTQAHLTNARNTNAAQHSAALAARQSEKSLPSDIEWLQMQATYGSQLPCRISTRRSGLSDIDREMQNAPRLDREA